MTPKYHITSFWRSVLKNQCGGPLNLIAQLHLFAQTLILFRKKINSSNCELEALSVVGCDLRHPAKRGGSLVAVLKPAGKLLQDATNSNLLPRELSQHKHTGGQWSSASKEKSMFDKETKGDQKDT